MVESCSTPKITLLCCAATRRNAVRNAQPIASIAIPEHQLDQAVPRVRALLDEE